jgi:hypothetical protein
MIRPSEKLLEPRHTLSLDAQMYLDILDYIAEMEKNVDIDLKQE